jgi:hypothetical protein
MSHRPSEEGELFWVELRQLLECPQISNISVHWDLRFDPSWLPVAVIIIFNLYGLVRQIKIELYR